MEKVIDLAKRPEPREIDYDIVGCDDCEQSLFLLVHEDDKITRIECATCGNAIAVDEVNGLIYMPLDYAEDDS